MNIPDRFYCAIIDDNMSHPVQLPCEHNFQREAIYQWLEKSNTCPICRYEVKWYETVKMNEVLQGEIIQFFNENPELEPPKELGKSNGCVDLLNSIRDRIILLGFFIAREARNAHVYYDINTDYNYRSVFEETYYP